MKPETFSVVLAFLIMSALFSPGQAPSGAETGIEGVITISPTQAGPVRDDSPASRPLANATFAVENEKGEVASFTTDGQGHFRTLVPPGHYKVSMKGRKSSIGRFGPFEVDVVDRQNDKRPMAVRFGHSIVAAYSDAQWNATSGARWLTRLPDGGFDQ